MNVKIQNKNQVFEKKGVKVQVVNKYTSAYEKHAESQYFSKTNRAQINAINLF